MKKYAATAAIHYIKNETIIGIGTGSTINIFIEELAKANLNISVISSSVQTSQLLKKYNIPEISFAEIVELPIYIDGADAYNQLNQLIKGRGGALTKEKILSYASKKFICIVDSTKIPALFHSTPIPLEVLPMARSFVARSIVQMGGQPEYRSGFITDNNNIILDVYNLPIHNPIKLERQLNNIPGVIANGMFAIRGADLIIVGTNAGSFLV